MDEKAWAIIKAIIFYFQILTDPKSLNYGATGDATPENKAKW